MYTYLYQERRDKQQIIKIYKQYSNLPSSLASGLTNKSGSVLHECYPNTSMQCIRCTLKAEPTLLKPYSTMTIMTDLPASSSYVTFCQQVSLSPEVFHLMSNTMCTLTNWKPLMACLPLCKIWNVMLECGIMQYTERACVLKAQCYSMVYMSKKLWLHK